MITAATQITTTANKWRVSSPNSALQFRQTPAAPDSIVGHSRRSYLWKCYYFVTKASPLCKSLQWPRHGDFHFHANNHFVGTGIQLSNIGISGCEMKLFRGRIRFSLWLHLNVKQLQQLSDYRLTIHRLETSSFHLRFFFSFLFFSG